VHFDRLRNLLLPFLIFTAAESAMAGDLAEVKRLLDQADRQAKEISIPMVPNDEARKAAGEVMRKYNSPEYQDRLHDEVEKIKSGLLPEAGTGDQAPVSREGRGQNAFLLENERIYVFISSSVPMATLKTYAAEIDKLKDPHITMVMQGFIDGMTRIKPTMQFIRTILRKDPRCDDLSQCPAYNVTVNINPMLFSRYGVDAAPAIVYVKGVDSADPEKSEGVVENTSIADAYVVSGDVSLEYALDVIGRQSHSGQIAAILTLLRKGFYN